MTINLESEAEAERALALASDLGVTPSLAIRVNPPFGLKGAGMKMGGHGSPFGIDHDRVPALVGELVAAGADWHGLHIYAGSQALSADAVIELQRETIALAASIAEQAGHALRHVNLGGGFGIPYFAKDEPLDLEAVGAALAKSLEKRPKILRDTRFAIELGRWLVGEAGVYLTRIVDRKVSRGRTFLVTDGGLHHMLAASGNFGQLLRRNYPVAIANRFGAEPEEEVDHRRLPVHPARPPRRRGLLPARRGRRPRRHLLRRRLRPQRQPDGLPQPADGERDAGLAGVTRADEIKPLRRGVEAKRGPVPRRERRAISSGDHCPRPTIARQPTIERTW